jgi:hypothetical protein
VHVIIVIIIIDSKLECNIYKILILTRFRVSIGNATETCGSRVSPARTQCTKDDCDGCSCLYAVVWIGAVFNNTLNSTCPQARGRPAPRLAGPLRPTLGPSALAERRLAAATAGLRKASELFKHSCPIYSHNEPQADRGLGLLGARSRLEIGYINPITVAIRSVTNRITAIGSNLTAT